MQIVKCKKRGPYKKQNPLERFMKFVKKTHTCWTWTGCIDRHGYGLFHLAKRKSKYSNRISWELQRGAIPQGMYVLHKCDNPACVRIDHLFLGTQKDNIQDMIKKGRQCTGQSHPGSKLTEKQIREIRNSYVPHWGAFTRLAKKYHVNKTLIRRIIHHIAWKHVI